MERAGQGDAVAALRRRLDEFDSTGDVELLAGPGGLRAAAEVRPIVAAPPGPAEGNTVEAMLQLARWHWYRHLVLTPRPDQAAQPVAGRADLPAAVALAHRLEAAAPHRLPLPMRALLGSPPEPVPADPPALGGGPAEWFTEAVLMMRRAEVSGDYSMIDRADTLLTRAVAATPAKHRRRADYLWALGRLNRDRFQQFGDTGALDRCVDLEEQALDATAPDHPSRAIRLLTLANALADQYEVSTDGAALDDAVDLLREATRRSDRDTALRTSALLCLGQVTRRRWQVRQERHDLDEAIEAFENAAAAAHGGGLAADEVSLSQRGLAELYEDRYRLAGGAGDLDAAVQSYWRIVESADSLAEEARLRHTLAGLLLLRHDRSTGSGDPGQPDPRRDPNDANDPADASRSAELADLDAAERVLRRTASITSPQDPLHAAGLADLGGALSRRYWHSGDLEALRSAVAACRQAVQLTPPRDATRRARLGALGAAARTLFSRTGDEELLAEAVAALREAVAGRAADPATLVELARVLLAAGEAVPQYEAALEAAAAARRAVAATGDGHPERPGRLLTLGAALNRAAELSPGPQAGGDPDEAARVLSELTREGPAQAAPWAALADAHRLRYRRTGDVADLQHGAALLRRALDADSEDEPDADPGQRPALLTALGDTALASARIRPEAPMLRTATDALASAVAGLDDDDPARAGVLLDLSLALELSAGPGRPQDVRHRARAAARSASTVQAAASVLRLRAARQWARLAEQDGLPDEALEAYQQALELLDLLSWSRPRDHGPGTSAVAAEFGGLPADAAGCAIAAGRPPDAVALLEQGRDALAAHTLGLPSRLARQLAEQAPALADQLSRLQARFEPPPFPPDSGPLPGTLGEPGAITAARRGRLRLAAERQALLERIRALPGRQRFLRPQPFPELAGAASGGPVILVNSTDDRSDALLVAGGTVTAVRLPALMLDEIPSRAVSFLNGNGGPETLYWLWEAVAEPVLQALGLSAPASPQAITRLWWCCTGPLSLLPLHAATPRPATGKPLPDGVMERAVPSWTPSLAALLPAPAADPPAPGHPSPASPVERRRWRQHLRALVAGAGPAAAPPGPGSALFVSAGAPGPGDAAGAHQTEDALARAVPRLHRLTGPDASAEAVSAALPQHDVVHLNGPVHYRPAAADGGLLELSDGPLPLRLLPGLAGSIVLSGSEIDDADLHGLRHALSPADVLLLAGAQQVITPTGVVDAALAARVAGVLYQGLAASGTADWSAAPMLREALLRERARLPERPEVWAAFRHLGR